MFMKFLVIFAILGASWARPHPQLNLNLKPAVVPIVPPNLQNLGYDLNEEDQELFDLLIKDPQNYELLKPIPVTYDHNHNMLVDPVHIRDFTAKLIQQGQQGQVNRPVGGGRDPTGFGLNGFESTGNNLNQVGQQRPPILSFIPAGQLLG